MGAINVGGFSHFDQAFLLDISGYVTLQNTNFQNMPKKKTNRRLSKNSVLCNLHIKAYFD